MHPARTLIFILEHALLGLVGFCSQLRTPSIAEFCQAHVASGAGLRYFDWQSVRLHKHFDCTGIAPRHSVVLIWSYITRLLHNFDCNRYAQRLAEKALLSLLISFQAWDEKRNSKLKGMELKQTKCVGDEVPNLSGSGLRCQNGRNHMLPFVDGSSQAIWDS